MLDHHHVYTDDTKQQFASVLVAAQISLRCAESLGVSLAAMRLGLDPSLTLSVLRLRESLPAGFTIEACDSYGVACAACAVTSSTALGHTSSAEAVATRPQKMAKRVFAFIIASRVCAEEQGVYLEYMKEIAVREGWCA